MRHVYTGFVEWREKYPGEKKVLSPEPRRTSEAFRVALEHGGTGRGFVVTAPPPFITHKSSVRSSDQGKHPEQRRSAEACQERAPPCVRAPVAPSGEIRKKLRHPSERQPNGSPEAAGSEERANVRTDACVRSARGGGGLYRRSVVGGSRLRFLTSATVRTDTFDNQSARFSPS
ncbi:hypothetical protein DPEC_G00350470 [Dallia pectoralis]|uniref:Uncharacterized protein n=1 Tax=Dallia pectoralis TaxID=75939 RepID=A0ACC2F1J3_DALPE|nr:hypothetical protein DPEC_G00350470 [Dallia pectoralis]